MVQIRYAERSDKDFWYSLDRYLPETEFEHKVQTERGYILSLDGDPIGLLRYNLFWDTLPFCTMLFIAEEYQRKGYGKQLLTYWENDMKKRGFKAVLLSSRADETSQYFYRKTGYKDCGCLIIDIPEYAQPAEIFFIKSII